MLKRKIKLNIAPNETFFLWGPRQCGKSTLVEDLFPDALMINLLETETLTKYATAPHLLREELRALKQKPSRVIIDEVQKLPELLDEVHLLIEKDKIAFGLCGSSARKLKRAHANMLGGRALRFELTGLIAAECPDFDLTQTLNTGYLPRHWLHPARAQAYLRGYIADYLKEEIMAESLVRNLPQFSSFLHAAALSDSETLSYSTIARDVGTSSQTIKDHFDILVDTLIGHRLQSWTKRPKRRVIEAPKFYFDDVGVVNLLARRSALQPGSAEYGKAFENWVFHELHAWLRYSERWDELSYWRLSSGIEVDFIVGNLEIAIEAKASSRIHSDHLNGLRELKIEHPMLARRIVVCLEKTRRLTEDGIEIIPAEEFARELWLTGQ